MVVMQQVGEQNGIKAEIPAPGRGAGIWWKVVSGETGAAKPSGDFFVGVATVRRGHVVAAKLQALDDGIIRAGVPNRPASTFILEVDPELKRGYVARYAWVDTGPEVATVQDRAFAKAVGHAEHPTQTVGRKARLAEFKEAVGKVVIGRVEGF